MGAKPQDSHVPRALYYGERQIAFDILEYELSPDPEILLYYNNEKDSGLYVFNGHRATNTRVHDVLSNGIITSEGIGFPTQYSVHWSPDAAYVVVGDDYHKRWEIIDIFHAHVVAPGWIIAYDAGGETWFSSWESDRAFKVENYYPDSRHPSRHETLNVTLDPFQIRAEDGTVRWPRP